MKTLLYSASSTCFRAFPGHASSGSPRGQLHGRRGEPEGRGVVVVARRLLQQLLGHYGLVAAEGQEDREHLT